MQEARDHVTSSNEPAGEWQTADALHTNPIGGVVLCRFTGERVGEKFSECPRRGHTHPDVECFEIFWSASAIANGLINNDLVASEIRIGGNDVVYVHPVAARDQ